MTLAQTINPEQKPLQTWDYKNFEYPDPVNEVADRFNAVSYEQHMASVQGTTDVAPSGIGFALLSERGDSTTDAIVHLHPFCNGLTNNMLLRAKFIKGVADKIGLTDEKGDNLPLYSLAAPSRTSGLVDIRPDRLKDIRFGDVGILAFRGLRIAVERNVKRLHLIGNSLGGSLVMSAVNLPLPYDVEFASATASATPNIAQRSKLGLGMAFLRQGSKLEEAIENGGIDAIAIAQSENTPRDFVREFLAQRVLNTALFRGLCWPTVSLETSAVPLTFAYGTDDPLTRPRDVQELLSEIDTFTGMLHVIEGKGVNHATPDDLRYLATLYGYGMTRGVS